MSERAKRVSRINNSKTVAGLERLKKLKSGEGRAIDYDEEEKAVFDYIDEEEYSEIVRKRKDANWIVEDGEGSGYYEDGREIFDDLGETSSGIDKNVSEYENYGSNQVKKVPLKIKQDQYAKLSKKNITNMKNYLLSNQKNIQKKSFEQIKVEDDDLLKDILDDINTSSKQQRAEESANQSNSGQINCKNKRKLTDIDEDIIESSYNSQNPFSISIDMNYENSNKKAKIENFDDNVLSDNLFSPQQIESEKNLNSDLNNCEIKNLLNVKKSAIDPSFSAENYQFNNNDNFSLDEKGDKILKAYWIDAFEDSKQPGVVYLFCKIFVEKINKYFSCCLICKNIEHKIYFYKRTHHRSDESTIVRQEDFEKEIKCVLEQHRIKNFRSRTTIKNYAFDKAVETKGEYLEVLFNPTITNTKLPFNSSGDTFSYLFNDSQSSLERFIIDLNLKGPCWLKIQNPISSSPPISWCKFEYVIENPFKQITINNTDQTEVPLSIMSFSFKTHINPLTKQNEIIAISCISKSEYLISKNNDKNLLSGTDDIESYCLITEPSNKLSTSFTSNMTTNSCENTIKFPFNFKKHWDKKIEKKFQINIVPNEKELVMLFIIKLFKKDPDVLIGHDLNSFDLNILKKRFEFYKILGQYWSKIGRLRRGIGSKATEKDLRNLTVGRLVCDVEVAAKELIRSKSYDLKELAVQVLKRDRIEYKPENLLNYFKSESDILRFIEIVNEDTILINSLFVELNVLPLYFEITKIAGNLFSRTLLGGRSERNEYLLMHAFHEHNYILPNKIEKDNKKIALKFTENMDNVEEREAITISTSKRNRKAAYTGGLVLEPKIGLYDKYILLMDFNSLYPSIIQEYKICFTTVNRKQFLEYLKEDSGEFEKQLEIQSENFDKEKCCILPAVIKKLVDERRKVKSLILQPETTVQMKQQLDIKQKALKLTANSIYGCLGFGNSRFYAKPLAALITQKGREILSKTKQLLEESSLKLEVIYGDTDSLMINTKSNTYEEAESLGYRLKAEINKNYNLLEIDIDGIFKSILLLKKKKYAALVAKKINGNQIKFEREIKGLDIIRRDWSLIAKNVGENVLNMILTEDNKQSEEIISDIHNYLSSIAEQINNKKLPTGVYLISKQLTKDLKDYKDAKGQPHALVAIRWNSKPDCVRKFKAGDIVQYLICIDKENKENFNNLPSTQRAFHLEEYKKRNDLEIDTNYYLQSQIHPIVSRLVDPIDGTDANVIAEFLGIESTFSTSNQKGVDLDYELLTRTNETRFDTCKSIVFICPNKNCKQIISLRSLVEKDTKNGKFKLNFDKCSNCDECFADEKYRNYFVNHLTVYLRSLLNEYYQTWFICEDPTCKFRTRRFSSLMTKKGPICPECCESTLYAQISDAQIYLQFSFFSHILESKRVIQDLPKSSNDENLKNIKDRLDQLSVFYLRLLDVVQNFKKQQAYDVVDLTFLFCKQVFSFVNYD